MGFFSSDPAKNEIRALKREQQEVMIENSGARNAPGSKGWTDAEARTKDLQKRIDKIEKGRGRG